MDPFVNKRDKLEGMEEKSNLDKIRSSMKFDRTNFVPNSAIELNRGRLYQPRILPNIVRDGFVLPNWGKDRVPPSLLPQFKFLIDHNGTKAASNICSKFAIPIKSKRIRAWVRRQMDYIERLTDDDKIILKSYSRYGDSLINSYLRGTSRDCEELLRNMLEDPRIPVLQYLLLEKLEYYTPILHLSSIEEIMSSFEMEDTEELLMSEDDSMLHIERERQEKAHLLHIMRVFIDGNIKYFREPANLAPIIELYKSKLLRIITESPRLDHIVTVYRGFNSEDHLTGLSFNNADFISTSLDLNAAINFSLIRTRKTKPQVFGGVYELQLHPSTICIYMEPTTCYFDEFEILIMPGMNFKLDSKIYYKILRKQNSNLNSVLVNTGTEDKVAIVHGDVSAIPFDPPAVGGRRKTHKRSKKLKARR